MGYLIILALIIVFSLILKISSDYLFLLTGLLIILHPILIAKEQVTTAYQLSIFVFLLFLSALIIRVIKNLLPFKIDEQDSFIVSLIEKNIKIRITGVRVGNHYVKKNYLSIILSIIFVFLVWEVNLTTAALSVLFLAFFLYKWDSRIMAVLALACLITCPFLLIFKNKLLAENFAIYTYYFLVLTVILQIIEYKRVDKFPVQELERLNDNIEKE